MASEVGQLLQFLYRRPDTVKCGEKMCFQNSPEIVQKLIARISFSTGIVDIDSMKRISPQVLTFLGIMPFLIINLFMGHWLLS